MEELTEMGPRESQVVPSPPVITNGPGRLSTAYDMFARHLLNVIYAERFLNLLCDLLILRKGIHC